MTRKMERIPLPRRRRQASKKALCSLSTLLGGEFELWSSPLPSFEYSVFGCVRHKTLAAGIDAPSGIAVDGNVLLVGESGTGKIIALHKTTGQR